MSTRADDDANAAKGAGAPTPPPLDAAALKRIPGVLGRIARERAADYATAAVMPAGYAARDRDAARSSFAAALAGPDLAVIAEIKRRSPSRGEIAVVDPVTAAQAYVRGGAAAVSVLTEPRHFGGALDHLRLVARSVPVPVLRKDFVVHPAQLLEAADCGAAAVLLIVAVLEERTGEFLELSRRLGLDALVEVHDESELQLAIAAGAGVLGVNNRDLRTLAVDLDNAPRLMRAARRRGFDGLLVAESGYGARGDLKELRGLADAVLVGTSVVQQGDLEHAVRGLRCG